MCDELVDTEQPGDRQETSKRPESEPLEEINHLLGEVLNDLGGQRKRDNHDGQEDGTGEISGYRDNTHEEVTYRRRKNRIPKKIARRRTLIVSAFWKTLTRQYVNAATQRNHSSKAASMTLPTIAT